MRALLLLVLVALLAPGRASADVLVPGHKPVEHRLVLADSPALEGWTLFASPSAGFGGVAVIEVGAPFDFSAKYGTRIFALPAGAPVPEDWWGPEGAPDSSWIAADVPVQEVQSARVGHPLAEVLTTVRVESIDAAQGIAFTVLGEQRFAADGTPVQERWRQLGLLALGIVGLAGVVGIGRRRARAAAQGR